MGKPRQLVNDVMNCRRRRAPMGQQRAADATPMTRRYRLLCNADRWRRKYLVRDE